MQACALHNCSKALKLACSSAGPRDFLSLPTFTKAHRLRRWEEHAFLSTPAIDSSYYNIYIYMYLILPFTFFLSFLIYLSSRKKKGKIVARKGKERRKVKGKGGEEEKVGIKRRVWFVPIESSRESVGHMAGERAACVGVACQAFLRAARKLVTSVATACVSDQSRPDYLTPRRAYVAFPPLAWPPPFIAINPRFEIKPRR